MEYTEVDVVELSQIEVGDRVREDFGNISELAESIKRDNLIQPLAVKRSSDNKFILLAGGRRLKACEKAGISRVPVRIYPDDLTDLQMKRVEYAENYYRKDLIWSESTKICYEITLLEQSIQGPKISTAKDAKGWSLQDTANLLGKSKATVVQDIKLAKALEQFPELATIKDKTEAMRKLRRLGENVVKEELARKVQENRQSTPLDAQRNQLVNSFIIGNALEEIKKIPDGSINIVEIDPPYAINLQKNKSAIDNQTDEYNEVDKDDYYAMMSTIIQEAFRVLNSEGWLICWFGPDPWFEEIAEIIEEAGFKFRRLPGLWIKPNGQTKQPSVYLANAAEYFFYARKEAGSIVKQGRINVFNYPPVNPLSKIHPTERPIEMIEDLLSTFGKPTSRVLIPFLGSGNTLLAASNLGMTALGFELSSEYKDRFTLRVFSSQPGAFKSYAKEVKSDKVP